ncbi:hypothetical protein DFS34DRAFT_648922 [Phlyctochytrium arcticum]|nr:hypothetical protein DFS34DRAFT_648922 [Phlyctochytrium arcticum]
MGMPEPSEELKQKLIGKTLAHKGKSKSDLTARGVPEADIVTEADIPEPRRILGPRSMATMDYVDNRLNVHIDENDVIQTLKLG